MPAADTVSQAGAQHAGVKQDLARRFPVVALLAVPLVMAALATVYMTNVALLTPDSPGYMYFGEDRPAGYPLFLQAVKTLFGTFRAVPPVQFVVLFASIGGLATAVYYLSGSVLLSFAFEALVIANPGLLLLCGQIMSEPISAACIGLFIAVLLSMVRSASLSQCIALSTISAVAITIRPVNIALVPAALLAILVLYDGRRWAQVLLLIVLACGATQFTYAVHALRHDAPRVADPMARGLFQKTLFRQWPETAESENCDSAIVARETKAATDYISHAPDDLQEFLKYYYSSYLRFAVIIPELVDVHKAESFTEVDPILMCLARIHERSDPMFFLHDAGRQLWGLLTYSTYVSQARHDRIADYLTKVPPPRPLAVARHDVDFQLSERAIGELGLDHSMLHTSDTDSIPKARSRILTSGLCALQLSSAAAMFWGMIRLLMAMFRSKDTRDHMGRTWCAVGVCGVVFFGETVITSFIEIAQPRYIYPLWSITCAALLLCFMLGLEHFSAAKAQQQ